jgi:predicted nucleic acid-binding protein
LNILVDTCVWSLALRRDARGGAHPAVFKLRSLIEAGQPIVILGIILQEILQGVRSQAQYERLRAALASFPLIEPRRADYEEAAALRNACRSRGVQAGTIDFLVAAAAIRHNCALLTTDQDFSRISRHSSLRLV